MDDQLRRLTEAVLALGLSPDAVRSTLIALGRDATVGARPSDAIELAQTIDATSRSSLDLAPTGAFDADSADIAGSVRRPAHAVTGQPRRVVPGARLGRHEVRDRLGAGGMGEVVLAHDPRLDREVAAKVLKQATDPALRAKFIAEARTTGRLEHPNIVPVHDMAASDEGPSWFTMKRVRGRDLAARLRDPASGDVRAELHERLGIFTKVCDAIAYAHSEGVIHRDLKPANVMVGAFGEVLVMDWGLAKRVGEADARAGELAPPSPESGADALAPAATLAGTILGTPAYMSPEQAAGQVERLDARSDVYALGAILYEMVTGVPPFSGPTPWDVIERVAQGGLVPPSQAGSGRAVPWELESVVLRAMAFRPEDRYPTALALKADVERYLRGGLLAAARYSPLQRLGKWVARHRAACLAVIATATVLGGAAGFQRARSERAVARMIDRGTEELNRGQLGEALEAYEAALALDPGNTDAARGRAEAAVRVALDKVATELARSADVADIEAAHRARLAMAESGGVLPPEGFAEREARERVFASAIAAVGELDRAIAESPGHAGLIEARRRAGDRGGRIALAGEDFTLARQAYLDLERLGDAEALVRVREVESARERKEALRARRLAAILDDVARGLARADRDPAAPRMDELVAEAAAYRDRASFGVITRTLEPLIARAAAGERDDTWTEAERDVARFATRALAQPGSVEAAALLGRWMDVVTDPTLAAEAGFALCACRVVAAHAPLERARVRLGPDHPAWMQIRPFLERVPERIAGEASTLDLQTLVQRGQLRVERESWGGALSDFGAAIARDPTYAPAWFYRARARLETGDVDGALADVDRAIDLADGPEARSFRAMVRVRRGDPRGAGSDLDRAIEMGPRVAVYRNNRAHHRRVELGDYAGAIDDATAAIEIEPGLAHAWLNRGMAHSSVGNHALALADLDRAVQLAPRDPMAVCYRGRVRSAAGDGPGALADQDRAIALAPRFAEAYVARAELHQWRGEPAGARGALDRAVELAPGQAFTWQARADLRANGGDFTGAIEDGTRAIELAPGMGAAWAVRSWARAELGQAEGALADADRATEVSPRWWYAHVIRGVARMKGGDVAGAISDTRKAVELDDSRFVAWRNLGHLLAAAGDRAGAAQAFRRAIERAPPGAKAELEALMQAQDR